MGSATTPLQTEPVKNGQNSDDATRGRPYYEKLRRDLKHSIEQKRRLDHSMALLESNLAKMEDKYLEETSAAGNIIKGFDNYLKASATTTTSSSGPGTTTRRKGGVSDQDRIFSRSSVSWTLRDSPAPLTLNHASASASHAATPTALAGSGRDTPTGASLKATNKKKAADKEKTKEESEDGDRPPKRHKVSWGRD